MGWGVTLNDSTGRPCQASRHTYGSNYAVGGTTNASTNITFNYAVEYAACGVTVPAWTDHRHRTRTDFSPWWLHGRTGRETAPVLMQAIQALGTTRDADYWASTPGNAGYALSVLWLWAVDHPDGVWEVD